MTPQSPLRAAGKEVFGDEPPTYEELGTLTAAKFAAEPGNKPDEDAGSLSNNSMLTTASSVRRQMESGGGLHISQTVVQHCPHTAARQQRWDVGGKQTPPPTPPMREQRQWTPDHKPRCVPLLDFLCAHVRCHPAQLVERLRHPQRKRDAVQLLRDAYLLTTHLKPQWRNIRVICHDLTTRGAALLPAYGGFMNVKVAQHYYIRHRIKLQHPDLPCVAEYGPNGRRSYFPLEALSVLL